MAIVRMTLVLLVILAMARTSRACVCGLRHPQEMFCIADFVVRLEVMEMEEVYSNEVPIRHTPTEVRYLVDISYVYKGTEKFDQADKLYLRTGGSGASCRQDLVVGELYIIMGYVHDGQMTFGMCDWSSRLEDLTSHQYRGLRFKYNRNCGCEIQSCYREGCDLLDNRNDTCKWRNTNECDRSFSFCMEGPDGICSWRQNRMRHACLTGIPNA